MFERVSHVLVELADQFLDPELRGGVQRRILVDSRLVAKVMRGQKVFLKARRVLGTGVHGSLCFNAGGPARLRTQADLVPKPWAVSSSRCGSQGSRSP